MSGDALKATTYDLFGTNLNDLERASLTLLDRAVEYYRPAKVYALYSGGTDSTAAALLASSHPAFDGCLHLDTETGIAQTQEHVVKVCREQGWDLIIEPPRTTSYERLVTEKFGFPGSGQHAACYGHLKDRALSRLTAKKRAGGVTLLVSGARTGESVRRMGNAKLLSEDGNRVWLNPCLSWPKAATEDYATARGVERSPVSTALGMSGECLCGSYARPGELNLIRAHYPESAEYIDWLAAKARERGLWDVWGVNPPKRAKTWPNSPRLAGEAIACSGCAERRL